MRILHAAAVITLSSLSVGQLPVWQQKYFPLGPSAPIAITYDDSQERVLVIDREATGRIRVWSWDGRSWSVVPAQNAPTFANFSGLATCFDGIRRVLLLVRHSSSVIETWELPSTTATWAQIGAVGAPPLQNPIGLHYSRARASGLLIGQQIGSPSLGVWEYTPGRWQLRPAAVAPTGGAHNTAYDTVRNRIVLFNSAETWEWDGAGWIRRLPSNSPPGRGTTAIAYDQARERCVLYGGSNFNPFTWEWDGDNWAMNLTAPPAAQLGRMAYDARRGRMVFVAEYTGETWEYFVPRQATYTPFGTACAGSGGLPSLAAVGGSLPWLGETLTVRLTNLPNVPTAVPFGLMGSSRTSWLGIPLPLELGVIGAPGCSLFSSVDLVSQLVNTAGVAEWPVTIPSTISLLGANFYQQGMVLDPAANSLGVVFTNAARATIGDH